MQEGLSLSKKDFDRLVDGGASSPATATPSRFHLNPSDSGREICKEAIFSSENKFSYAKISPERDVLAAALDFFGRSASFFDKQSPSCYARRAQKCISGDLLLIQASLQW